MTRIGHYRTEPFTQERKNISIILKENARKNNINALVEADVTHGRQTIKELKKEKNIDISFSGWIVKCLAKALTEHKDLNSYRSGRKVYIFDDVDVNIPVERKIDEEARPRIYIIRRANEKTVEEISEEIRQVQREKIEASTQILGKNISLKEKIILKSPSFIKKLLLIITRRAPRLKKKYMGTVGVTSVGSVGKFPGWLLSLGGITTTFIDIGGIVKKPGVIKDEIKIREYLHLTVIVDHDIVNGAPLARFIDRFIELIEKGYSLKK